MESPPRTENEISAWVDDSNVALLTDLYELTMLQGYFRERMFGEAVFGLFVRSGLGRTRSPRDRLRTAADARRRRGAQGSARLLRRRGLRHEQRAVSIEARRLLDGAGLTGDSYSGFRNNWDRRGDRSPTGLGGYLEERRIEHVFVCGLARDVCVKWTAEDAAEIKTSRSTVVIVLFAPNPRLTRPPGTFPASHPSIS